MLIGQFTFSSGIQKPGVSSISQPSADIYPLKWENGPVWDETTECSYLSMEPDSGPGRTIGGPEMISPGQWVPYETENHLLAGVRTGWRFYWTHDIEQSQTDGTFGLSYDLIAFWNTYRLDTASGEWVPVWYYSRMQVENPTDGAGTYLEGNLMLPQKGSPDRSVGALQIYLEESDLPGAPPTTPTSPIPGQQAWINLSINDIGGMVVEDFQYAIQDFTLNSDIFEPGFDFFNPSKHWRGIWVESGDGFFNEDGEILEERDFFMTEWVVGPMVSMSLNGFDDAGDPVWVIAFTCDLQAGDADCNDVDEPYDAGQIQQVPSNEFNLIYPGIGPFWSADDDDEFDVMYNMTDEFADLAGGGVIRQLLNRPFDSSEQGLFDPRTDFWTGSMCVDISTAESYSFGRDFNLLLSTNPEAQDKCVNETDWVGIEKIANLHGIDFDLTTNEDPEASVCDVTGVEASQCELSLSWHTDDYFPNAIPMFSSATSNQELRPIDELCIENSGTDFGYVVIDRACTILDENIASAGEPFRFHLVVKNSTVPGFQPEQDAVIASSRTLTVYGGSDESSVEDPIDPVLATLPPPDPESSAVGATRGTFRVSESGSATYSIGLLTAPGSGGVAPEISLNYSSDGGIGPLGRGWQIGGQSVITRCGQTIESGDGETRGVELNQHDRFCLDGQRLMLQDGEYGADGSEYRLEIDSFARIVAYGGSVEIGPQYFVVEKKDGSVSIFGSNDEANESSHAITVPQGSTVFAWPIIRFLKTALRTTFCMTTIKPSQSESIEWYIDSIHYTGNAREGLEPYADIYFNYDPRDEDKKTTRYLAGHKLTLSQKLTSVESKCPGCAYADPEAGPNQGPSNDWLRYYRLNYATDQVGQYVLTSLQECWDHVDGNCFDPTVFDWSDAAFEVDVPSANDNDSVNVPDFLGGRVVDINGDNIGDYVYLRKLNSSSARFEYALGNVNAQGDIAFSSMGQGPVLSYGAGIDRPPPLGGARLQRRRPYPKSSTS